MLLQQRLELSDWEGVRAEIAIREHLLRKVFPDLLSHGVISKIRGAQDEFEQVRQTLEQVLTANQEFVNQLLARRQELGEKIREIGRGRKTLSLYRLPRLMTPRFFDRFG